MPNSALFRRRIWLAGALALLLMLSLVACATTPEASPSPAAAPPEEEAAPASVSPTPPPTFTPELAATAANPTAPPATAAPVLAVDGLISLDEYKNEASAAGITFYARIDGDTLVGALVAPTTGWVSVGFDPDNRMAGANYIFGYVTDGEVFAYDMYGTQPSGRDSHPLDTDLGGTDDLIEFEGNQVGQTTVLEFRIPLDSGDPYDKPLVPGETYTIILAMGPDTDLNSYHTARGETTITLNP